MLVLFRTVLLLGVTLSSAFTPSLMHHGPRARLRCSRPAKLAMSTRQPEDQAAGRILDRPSGRSYMSESFSRELLADERFASAAPVKFAKDAKVAASGSLTRRQRIARLSGVLLESAKAVGTRVAKLSKKAVSPQSWGTSSARAPVFVPTPRPAPPAKQAGTVELAATVKLQPQLAEMHASSAPGSVASDAGTDASDRMESLIRGYAKKHGGAEEASKVVRSEAPSPESGTGDDRLDQLLGGYSKRHGGGAPPPRSGTTTLTAAALDAPKAKVQRSKYADFGKSADEQDQPAISTRFTRSKEVAPDAEEGIMSRIIMGGSLKGGTARAGAVARHSAVALQELAPAQPESRLDQLVMKYASKYEKGGSKASKGSIRAPAPSPQPRAQAVVSYKTPPQALFSVSDELPVIEEVPAASAPAEPQSHASVLEAPSAEEEAPSGESEAPSGEWYAPSGEEDSAGVGSEELGEGVESQ